MSGFPDSALMIDAIEYIVCRKAQCCFAGVTPRPLEILNHRIRYRQHNIVQLALFKAMGVVIVITIPPHIQTQTEAFVLVV